jgi:type II secretory pathway component PulM
VITALAAILAKLNRRERALLLLLCVIVVPASIWFLWAKPLMFARDAAKHQLAEAQAIDQWVAARDADFKALGERVRGAAPIGIAGIERSLLEAGLRVAVDTLEEGREGRIVLSFRSVSFREFAAFAERIAPEFGYNIAALGIEAGDAPDIVSVSLELAAAN